MFEESVSEIPSSIWASMISWFTPTVLFVLLNLMIGTIAFTSKLTGQKHHENQHQNEPHHHDHEPKIARSTSVLQRLKSINFYAHYRSHQEPQNLSVHHKPTPDSATLFNLDHTTQNLEPQSHYFFQAVHQENLHQSQDPYVFEGTLEESSQETQTQFVFEQKDSNLNDFQQAHEEKDEEDDELQSMDEIYSQLKGGHFSRTKSDTEPTSGKIPTKLPARMRKSASLKSAFGHFEEENIVEARRPATVRERSNAKATEGDEEVDAKADDFINKFKQQLKLQRLDSILRYKDMIGRGIGGR
ncbi:Pathogen-associated molecular patterns-induced protein A70 [Sesamum alatum]|uniref:Pathogen-associated molecular patterns-induced protein A70 n=1 Tax=Sesamum alatum TaxID=300844 RepID=A0AAE2CHE9_9LAMI|nr:Pathogen-associated molecular patterns-induced protein A70 [Sesamum alatum]